MPLVLIYSRLSPSAELFTAHVWGHRSLETLFRRESRLRRGLGSTYTDLALAGLRLALGGQVAVHKERSDGLTSLAQSYTHQVGRARVDAVHISGYERDS